MGSGARGWGAAATPENAGRYALSTLGRQESFGASVGGAHIGKPDEAEAVRIIRAAIDGGITFMDNSWDYNSGASEVQMGKALKDGYREKAFLMTKIDGRTKASAAKQIDESLKRLQSTDHVDLMQFHEIMPDGRCRPDICEWRGDGGDAGSKAGRQSAIHWFYRPADR